MYRKKQKTQALLPTDYPAQKDGNPTKKALVIIKNERVFKYILLEKNKKIVHVNTVCIFLKNSTIRRDKTDILNKKKAC